MIFRISTIFFALWIGVPSLKAQTQGYPLGIVMRPKLIDGLVKALTGDADKSERGIVLPDICFLGKTYDISLKLGWKRQGWETSRPKGMSTESELIIPFQIALQQIQGDVYEGCDPNSRESKITTLTVRPKPNQETLLNMNVHLKPQNLIYKNLDSVSLSIDTLYGVSNSLEVHSPDWPGIAKLLSDPAKLDSFIMLGLDVATREMSSWLYNRFRGLNFSQSLFEMLGEESVVWKRGALIQRGALRLELARSLPSQREIRFVMQPYTAQFSFSSRQSLDLYVFSNFVSGPAYSSMMLNLLPPPPVDRPPLVQSQHHLSLVLPMDLMNSALQTIYREGLLRFVTRIASGEAMKGKIAKDVQDVEDVIQIGSKTAPQMRVRSHPSAKQNNSLQMLISDYVLGANKRIEDRLVPQAAIRVNSTIGAELKLNEAGDRLVLQLKTDDFQVQIDDASASSIEVLGSPAIPINSSDIEFFNRVAKGLWESYIGEFPNLEILPTLMNLGGTSLRISEVEIHHESIWVHLDLQEGTSIP